MRLKKTDILIAVVLIVELFFLIAIVRMPLIKSWAGIARHDFTSAALPLSVIFYIIYKFIKNKPFLILGVPWVLAAFILVLRSLWLYANSEPLVFAGLLPFSDASGFYQDALRLLNDQRIIATGANRPLYPVVLAGLLSSAKGSLMVVSLIIAVYTGICVFMLANETSCKYGPAAATLLTILLWLFWRGYAGTTMPEAIAPAWCCLGLGLLLRGMDHRKPFTLVSGLFMISMALNIRQGAYFVLPAIVLWIGWLLRQGNRISARFILLGVATILLAIAFNMIAYHLFVSTSVGIYGGGAVSSFPATLYGMTRGTGNWTSIYAEHPELVSIAPQQTSRYMLQLALDAFWKDPAAFFRVSLRALEEYFSAATGGMVGFVGGWNGLMSGVPSVVATTTRWILLGMAFLSLLSWKKSEGKLAVGLLLGRALSVPFMPPWEAGTRIYAATIPLTAILVTIGFSNFLDLFGQGLSLALRQLSNSRLKDLKIFSIVVREKSSNLTERLEMVFKIRPAAIRQSSISPINARTPYVLLVTSWLSMVLLVVMVLIYAIRSPSFTSEAIGHLCPDNQVLVNTHLFSGSYLIIDNQPTEMPKIEHGDFIQSAHDFMYSETLPDFLQIEVPAIIANVIDTKTSTGLWLISNGITLPADQDIQICVQPSDNQATRGMGFVYFKSYPEAIGLQTN